MLLGIGSKRAIIGQQKGRLSKYHQLTGMGKSSCVSDLLLYWLWPHYPMMNNALSLAKKRGLSIGISTAEYHRLTGMGKQEFSAYHRFFPACLHHLQQSKLWQHLFLYMCVAKHMVRVCSISKQSRILYWQTFKPSTMEAPALCPNSFPSPASWGITIYSSMKSIWWRYREDKRKGEEDEMHGIEEDKMEGESAHERQEQIAPCRSDSSHSIEHWRCYPDSVISSQ